MADCKLCTGGKLIVHKINVPLEDDTFREEERLKCNQCGTLFVPNFKYMLHEFQMVEEKKY